MKRLNQLDKLNLRTTSVYRNPRDISTLPVVAGDFTGSLIPCTPIDKDGYIHHISDCPIQLIVSVCVNGEPKTSGFMAHTAWQDETGKSIACVIFDEPLYEKKVSVKCKGAISLETGQLIENPADLIRYVLLNVQLYDEGSIDLGEISNFYAECLKEDIQVACYLEAGQLKDFFDELAKNIHAHWLLSDGKAVMRLRGAASERPMVFPFAEKDMVDFTVSSEPLQNYVTANFGYDFESQKFQSSLTKQNPLSKLIYEEASEKYDFRMIQSTRQAERVVDAILNTYSIPAIIVSFKHNQRSTRVETGDTVTVTHRTGPGGYVDAKGIVVKKDFIENSYSIVMEGTGNLHASELVSLTQVGATKAQEGFGVTYANGVATITIYAGVAGSPPVEGAEVTISGVKKFTNKQGQVRFNLKPGKYTAYIVASGYEDNEVTFSV